MNHNYNNMHAAKDPASNTMHQIVSTANARLSTQKAHSHTTHQHPKLRRAQQHQQDGTVPLNQWLNIESHSMYFMLEQDELILRRTTVAYGIVELLRCAKVSIHGVSANNLQRVCFIDNFGVSLAGKFNEEDEDSDRIVGVEMLTPFSSLRMITPFFTRGEFFGDESKVVGEYLEVEVNPPPLEFNTGAKEGIVEDEDGEMMLCHLVGCLMYDMFIQGNATYHQLIDKRNEPPPQKKYKTSPLSESALGLIEARENFFAKYIPLLELGFSSSVHLLVDGLIKGQVSLDTASKDLHLLVLDPRSFLFDRHNRLNKSFTTLTKPTLQIRKNKLYGREKETTLVTDTFCRLSSTGESEALMIGGFSGIGKSRLINKLCPYLDMAGGVVVCKKFDELQRANPLRVVISAFNDLCAKVKDTSSNEELDGIHQWLMSVFGTSFSRVYQVLPNVALLRGATNESAPTVRSEKDNEINSDSLAFIFQVLIRVISSKEKPVMMFLDDLQWADSKSLRVIADILSDIKGSSCMLFVGAYRDNEIQPDHPLNNFCDRLEAADVKLTRLHLSGMSKTDLHSLVSDSLCMLPSHCIDLSDTVHEKTNGSPLFAIEMLRSMVERDLLQYSTESRCWTYNLNVIRSEAVSNDVILLLRSKLRSLSKRTQRALMVSSTFGICMSKRIVECLSLTQKYADIEQELLEAVSSGYMESVDGSYRFTHDSVREASYSLISPDNREEYHFRVGMELLLVRSEDEDDDAILYPMADQLKHGVSSSSLIDSTDSRIRLAELFEKVGQKAMSSSDFSQASSYFVSSKSLLPEGHWASHYRFSIRLYLSLGHASYSTGSSTVAEESWNAVIINGKTLEDKLDAHYFMNTHLHSRGDTDKAFERSLDILSQLNENIPTSVQPTVIMEMVRRITVQLNGTSFLTSKQVNEGQHYRVMQFYLQANFMVALLCCRVIEMSLDNGFSKYSPLAFGFFSNFLLGQTRFQEANKFGKIALALLKRFDEPSLVPSVYISYYGFTAVFFEPLQLVAEQLRKGMDIGMSIGDTDKALINGLHYIQKAFAGGENLSTLLSSIDYQLKLGALHNNIRSRAFLSLFQQTISQLINKEAPSDDLVDKCNKDDILKAEGYQSIVYYHRVIASFWVGHNVRCQYFASKIESEEKSGQTTLGGGAPKLMGVLSTFYYGLAAIDKLKRKKDNEMKRTAKASIDKMKEFAQFSKHNYENKALLLEAEHLSLDKRRNEQARNKYLEAIKASEESKLVHEQGLCCELAGKHCEKSYNEPKQALIFYNQAKKCYKEWGSQMKVESMEKTIERLTLSPVKSFQ